MGGPFLVTVVESVELGRQDPKREQAEEDDRLDADSDVPDKLAVAEDGLDNRESSRESEQIGAEQHSPHEPTTAHSARGPFWLRNWRRFQLGRGAHSQAGGLGRASSRRRTERQPVSALPRAHNCLPR